MSDPSSCRVPLPAAHTRAAKARHSARARSNVRLARLLALAAIALLLGACAAPQPRSPAHVGNLPPMPAPPPPVDQAHPRPAATGLWAQLRRRYVFADCQRERVQHWAHWYTRSASVFTRQLHDALPKLRYIADILHAAGVPAEFTLLPWVESNFRALPTSGNRAAGMWQIMPGTARELNLRVDRDFDARLGLDESTRAAARLLQRNYDRFSSWSLADLAYNAGAYRVQRALQDHPEAASSEQWAKLGLKEVTVNHLAKIEALACIVKQPDQFGIELPDEDAGSQLVRRSLTHGLALPVAARLAGLPLARVREMNPAVRRTGSPTQVLILPHAHAQKFDIHYAKLQDLHWQQWRHVRIKQPETLLALTHDRPRHAAALALVNDTSDTEVLPDNAKLWLPSRLVAALPDSMQVRDASLPPRRYTVRKGDTLWGIAHRFNLAVAELRAWNGLTGSLLHLGQTLRLQRP